MKIKILIIIILLNSFSLFSKEKITDNLNVLNLTVDTQSINTQKKLSSDAINVLIKYGKNKKEWSALNYVLDIRDFSAAEILIDEQLDINVQEKDGYTPAIRLLSLIRLHKEERALLIRLFEKIMMSVNLQLKLQPELNFDLNQGQYLLLSSFWIEDSKHIIKLLLDQYQIDPNFDLNGKPSIQLFIESWHAILNPETLELLLKYGVNLNDVDCFSSFWIAFLPNNNNPEIHAEKFKESIILLISYGANPFITSSTDYKNTGIHQLLKKVLQLQVDNDSNTFKKIIIPFLISLGA